MSKRKNPNYALDSDDEDSSVSYNSKNSNESRVYVVGNKEYECSDLIREVDHFNELVFGDKARSSGTNRLPC